MVRYFFGREPDPTQPNIVINPNERTVSRQHGTIAAVGNGLYEVSDTDSAGGTYVREKGGWRRINTAEVHAEDEIRLGMRRRPGSRRADGFFYGYMDVPRDPPFIPKEGVLIRN
jgi:hypothetical protein